MDKQQAAKNYALKKNFKDSSGPIDIVTTSYSDGLQAGWEAHDAQCPGDAIAFAEWIDRSGYYNPKQDGLWYKEENGKGRPIGVPGKSASELYKLFKNG